MAKAKKESFSDIVAALEAEKAGPTKKKLRYGFKHDGSVVDLVGRQFFCTDESHEPSEFLALLPTSCCVALDDCGCMGGCPVVWLTEDDPRRRQTPEAGKRGHLAEIRIWKTEDDEVLLFVSGDVTWK